MFHCFIKLGMLPKPVADKLRQGKGVDAQGYESCTIFFR